MTRQIKSTRPGAGNPLAGRSPVPPVETDVPAAPSHSRVVLRIPKPAGGVETSTLLVPDHEDGRDALALLDAFIARYPPAPDAPTGNRPEAENASPAAISGPLISPRPSVRGRGAGVRETSRDALHRLQASGRLGRQETAVYAYFRARAGEDFTRQEAARALGLGINVVCGRVHALINDHGLLRETRRRACRVTGERAMAVGAVEGG